MHDFAMSVLSLAAFAAVLIVAINNSTPPKTKAKSKKR